MDSKLLTHRLSAMIKRVLDNQMEELIQNENARVERLLSLHPISNEKNDSGHAITKHKHGSFKDVAASQIKKSASIQVLNYWTGMVNYHQHSNKNKNKKLLPGKRQNKVRK